MNIVPFAHATFLLVDPAPHTLFQKSPDKPELLLGVVVTKYRIGERWPSPSHVHVLPVVNGQTLPLNLDSTAHFIRGVCRYRCDDPV
jgi:hypothetical protein